MYAQEDEKMYARIFISQIKRPEFIEDHLQIIKDVETIAEMQYADLKDVFHLVDRNSGKIIDIFFWETEEAASKWHLEDLKGVLREQFVKGMELVVAPPIDETYEVVL
jgi:predicted phosphatase